MFISWVGMPRAISLKISPRCHTPSNAFSTSRRMAAVFLLRFFEFTIESRMLTSCRVVLWCCLKPYCSGRILFKEYVFSLVRSRRSNTLLKEFRREIGRWLAGDRGSFPAFGSMITAVLFQHTGKYSMWAQPLNIRHLCRIRLLLQCFNAVLDCLSGPGAFLLDKDRIMLKLCLGRKIFPSYAGMRSYAYEQRHEWSRLEVDMTREFEVESA